jgi:hypothetical protein
VEKGHEMLCMMQELAQLQQEQQDVSRLQQAVNSIRVQMDGIEIKQVAALAELGRR